MVTSEAGIAISLTGLVTLTAIPAALAAESCGSTAPKTVKNCTNCMTHYSAPLSGMKLIDTLLLQHFRGQ